MVDQLINKITSFFSRGKKIKAKDPQLQKAIDEYEKGWKSLKSQVEEWIDAQDGDDIPDSIRDLLKR